MTPKVSSSSQTWRDFSPAVDFVVAGDGHERARLEQKVREMGLRNF